MSFKVVIPARYGSSRLPAKPLRDIAGKAMIQRVWERARQSGASEVIIATDHESILEACETFGAQAMLTSIDHPSGTDRLHEVCEQLNWSDESIVVNLQGDEPLFPPELIDKLANNLAQNTDAAIATFCQAVESWGQFLNPNVVKVVTDRDNFALYFSRAPIPWDRDNELTVQLKDLEKSTTDYRLDFKVPGGKPREAYRHIGIYAYRVATLKKFVAYASLPAGDSSVTPASYEDIEKLEQLRALDHNLKIHCPVTTVTIPHGVDTEEDLSQVIEAIQRRS